jgi:alpha-tubulin suppressor-like RCC1 family protein
MNELGGVRCWGSDFWGESALPAGTYDDFSVGNDVTCGLTDGQLVCVGDQDLLPPPGEYMDVGAGRRYAACALEADGSAVCWGFCNYGICADAPDGPFVEIATGEDHACALAADGAVTCWGSDVDDELDVPAGAFTQIDAGAAHTCGVRQDGSVACWGANPSGQSDPPEGTFNDVAAGWHHSCGVKDDGEIACWGRDEAGKFPAGNGWAAVAAGENHSCAVALDGSVSCWGADEAGQSTPPAL